MNMEGNLRLGELCFTFVAWSSVVQRPPQIELAAEILKGRCFDAQAPGKFDSPCPVHLVATMRKNCLLLSRLLIHPGYLILGLGFEEMADYRLSCKDIV